MPYAIQVDKEIMENILHEIDLEEAYNELWQCTIVINETKLDELFSPTWR
jgi:SUMO ligase MMS21 Smc5/6 complex component